MKIALVAQHATPQSGDVDRSGHTDDTRLVELSRSLAGNGHRVTVYAQRHSATLPERVQLLPGVTVEYLGQAAGVDESDLLAGVPAFSRPLHERWIQDRPDGPSPGWRAGSRAVRRSP